MAVVNQEKGKNKTEMYMCVCDFVVVLLSGPVVGYLVNGAEWNSTYFIYTFLRSIFVLPFEKVWY